VLRDAQVLDELPGGIRQVLRPPASCLRRNVRNGVVERRVGVVPGEGFSDQVADGFVAYGLIMQRATAATAEAG